jgi:hypothetical protein
MPANSKLAAVSMIFDIVVGRLIAAHTRSVGEYRWARTSRFSSHRVTSSATSWAVS